jgi:hypothetical protein
MSDQTKMSNEERVKTIFEAADDIAKRHSLMFMEKVNTHIEHFDTTQRCLEKIIKLGLVVLVKSLKESSYDTGIKMLGVIPELTMNFVPRDIDIAVAKGLVEVLEKSKELNS